MRISLLALAVAIAACGNDDLGNGASECGPNGACPAGYQCSGANLCLAGGSGVDGGGVSPDADARASIDGGANGGDARPADGGASADARLEDARLPDAAAPPPDAAVPPADAAVLPPDATLPPPDAAVRPPDAAVRPPDAVVPPPPPDAPPAPVDTQLDQTPASLTRDATATFDFSSPTAGATFECAIDSSPPVFQACASPAIFPGLADGSHTFAVRASAHGASDPTPATFAWTVDTTPPVVTLLGPSNDVTTGTAVTFTFASEPGATLTCALDSPDLAPCPSGAAQLSIAVAGAHAFTVVATDAAGNPSDPVVASFIVDTSTPTVTITPVHNDHTIETGAIGYTADMNSSFFCGLDAQAFTACPASGFAFTNLAAGVHALRVHAVNALGNLGADASYSFNVDGPLVVTVLDGNTPMSGTVQTIDAAQTGVALYTGGTDADGVAHLHVPEGGMLSFGVFTNTTSFAFIMTDVHGYQNLRIGRPSPGAAVTRGTLTRTLPALPAGASCVDDQLDSLQTGCLAFASPSTLDVLGGALDATGKVNLLEVAGPGPIAGYGWVPGITFVPGGNAAASIPGWLAPVPTTFTVSNVPASDFFQADIGMNGLLYPINLSFAVLPAGAGPASIVVPMPPAGVGHPIFEVHRFSTNGNLQDRQILRTDANHFDGGDLVTPTQDFAFVDQRGLAFTYTTPTSVSGIVTDMQWSEGAQFFELIFVTPPTGTLTFTRVNGIGGPSQGTTVGVTQLAVDVASWTEADFEQGFMPLFGSMTSGFPIPDLGAGNRVRLSQSIEDLVQGAN